MKKEILMPKIGMTMESGLLTKWFKAAGDTFIRDEEIAQFETNKTVHSITMPFDGIVVSIEVEEGTEVRCGELIAVVDTEIAGAALSKKTAEQAAAGEQSAAILEDRVEPLTGFRKVIADRLLLSRRTAPQGMASRELDVTEIVKYREAINQNRSKEDKISYNDIFIKAIAKALVNHKNLNASLQNDLITYHQHINVGVAIAVDNGIIIPVVHDADQKSVQEISSYTRMVVQKAQDRTLTGGEVNGGTVTITNLGMFGIDVMLPILNLPQCIIIGLGSIVKKPVVISDEIVIRSMLRITITADHRMTDGVPVAYFMADLQKVLANPQGNL